MTFAAAYEDPPAVWGVGRLVVGGELVPWAVSQHDIDDEAESQAARLAGLGVGAGDLVLIVSLLSQAIHVVPLEKAAGRLGALYSSADATLADARRTASLVRQLEPVAVVGVSAPVLDGLAELGRDPAEVFGSVRAIVTADDTAREALVDAGLAPRRWVKLGPTSAWEETPDTVSYDPARWHAEDDDGEILLTNVALRLTPCEQLRTGIRAHVIEPGTIAIV